MAIALSAKVGMGAVLGFVDFLFSTTAQKTAMIAGIKFEEIQDEDDVHPSQRLDRDFKDMVIKYPILEECVFRGLLQPFLAQAIGFFMPSLQAQSVLGLSLANIGAAVTIGAAFGTVHYFVYEQGGVVTGLISGVSGSAYGIAKEYYGLPCSVVAHMTHNLMTGLLDKHCPTFLESEREAAMRKT